MMNTADPVTQSKPKLLVVDDSRVMRFAFKKILGADYDVIMAENGEAAWNLLAHSEQINIVFTDLSMPVVDGIELLARIRGSDKEQIRQIPVIIITGNEDVEETKQKVLSMGANDFISKPFDKSQLRARAASYLHWKHTSEKLAETEQKLFEERAVDEATGLGSRRYFEIAAAESLSQLLRHGGDCAMMLINLDNLKSIREIHGDLIADAILSTVGTRLSTLVRAEDKTARYDETTLAIFLVSANLQGARRMAERLCTKNNRLIFTVNSKKLPVSFSIGIYEPVIDRDTRLTAIMHETERCLTAAGDGNTLVRSARLPEPAAASVSRKQPELSLPQALNLLALGRTEAIIESRKSLLEQLKPLLTVLLNDREMLQDISRMLVEIELLTDTTGAKQ